MLLASKQGYQLRLAPGQLDAKVFTDELPAARELAAANDPAGGGRVVRGRAAPLAGRAALAGIPGPGAEIVRAGLGEQRLTATEEHIEVTLALAATRWPPSGWWSWCRRTRCW